ncbi:MAG: metallophosphoesterase [Myxococcota bacterium]
MFLQLWKYFIFTFVFAIFLTGCKTTINNNNKQQPLDNPPESDSKEKLLPPDCSRIVAIGDLHGDFDVAMQTLQLAGAINKTGKWIGKKLIVVQTGDILDKGDQEKKIINLFAKLKKEATKTGGAVHTLLGNHEILNFRGEFDYVTSKGFKSFAKTKISPSTYQELEPEKRGRAAAFARGGPMSSFFAQNKVILKLGKVIFVHGGLNLEHLNYGIKKINNRTSAFIKNKNKLPAIMRGNKAPTWLRYFSQNLDTTKCRRLNKVLERAGAEKMVVGHTIQKKGITSGCKGKIWRIDAGMSRYYGQRTLKIIEISNDGIKILTTERK